MNTVFLDFCMLQRRASLGAEAFHWMNLIRKKHAETYRHCIRVAVIGSMMGEALKLAPLDQEQLVAGCFLHDLGKIMIPTKTLASPFSLTEQDWRLMKLHPVIGAEILSQAQMTPPAVLSIVRNHHERWDGKGYPDGLAEEETALHARLCSVADAFDSMVSNRPYQAKKTHDQALWEIYKYAGTQFDIAAVHCLGGIMDRIRRMYLVPPEMDHLRKE